MNFYSKLLAKAGLLTNYADFDTASTQVGAVGRMVWNDADGTVNLGLKGGNVTLQIGQKQVARVVNKSGGALSQSDYQVVKVTDAQGQRLAVNLAQANNDANSADTLGIVTETIALNQEGFITTSGVVRDINTTGSLQGETWADGDILYLSPTTPGAITNIKPTAPQHMVIVGYVEYAHGVHGKIFVKVQNGYELDELHNVLITTPLNNQVLGYESSTGLWKNKSIADWLGYTPANAASISGTTGKLAKFTSSGAVGDSIVTESSNGITTSINQSASTTLVVVENTNNTSGTARASLRSISGAVTSELLSISGFGLFLGTSSNHRVSLMMNGSEYLGINATNGRIQTNQATDTGESFIVGGSARVNGFMLATGLLRTQDRLYITGDVAISSWISSSLTAGYSSTSSYGWMNSQTSLRLGVNGSTQLNLTTSSATFSSSVTTGGNIIVNNGSDRFIASTSGVVQWNPAGVGGLLTWDTGRAIVAANSTNALSFVTNGNERMRIVSGGNVLINTTTDNGVDKLQVNGSAKLNNYLAIASASPYIELTDTTNNIVHYLEGNDTSLVLYSDFGNTQSGSLIDFRIDGNTSRMSLSATELITFGATDTGEAHIFGGTGRFNGSLAVVSGNDGGLFRFYNNLASASSRSWRLINDVSANGDFAIQQSTTQTGNTFTDRLYFASNGAVTFSSSVTAGASVTIGTGGNYAAGSIYSDANWGMIFRAKQASPALANFLWTDSADNELMRISATGNLGIRTTSPTEILHLNSSAPVIRYQKTGVLNWYAGNVSGNSYIISNDVSGNSLELNVNTGAATFSSSVTTGGHITSGAGVTIAASNNLTWGGLYGANIPTITASHTNGIYYYPIGSSSPTALFRMTTAGALIVNGESDNGVDKLQVNGSARVNGVDPFLRISNISGDNHGIKISYLNSDTHGLHLIYNANAATSFIENTYPSTTGQPYGDIHFRQNVGGTMTTRILIKAENGNVLIGTTTNAGYKLEVSGDTRLRNKTYIGTNGAYLEEYYDGSVYKVKIVDSAGNDIIL